MSAPAAKRCFWRPGQPRAPPDTSIASSGGRKEPRSPPQAFQKLRRRRMKLTTALLAAVSLLGLSSVAQAQWKPTKPIEFVVTSAPGGATDNFARMVQSIVAKHNLADVPIVVTNKGGGSGAEGFVYGKSQAGDPTKLIFATNNEYLLPLVAKLAFKPAELTPVAAMALDEFLLWVNGNSPYKDAQSYLAAAKAGSLKMGGSQSKDTDQTLTSIITGATGAPFIY